MGKSRCRMKWLMHVTNKVQEPYEVVSLQRVGYAGRGDRVPEKANAFLGINRGRLDQRRAIRRERPVSIVPILVHILVVKAGVAARIRRRCWVLAVIVKGVPVLFDRIRSGR